MVTHATDRDITREILTLTITVLEGINDRLDQLTELSETIIDEITTLGAEIAADQEQ